MVSWQTSVTAISPPPRPKRSSDGSRVPEAMETGVSSGNYRSLPGYWSPGTARDEDNKSITTTGTWASVNVIETHNNTSQCGHINDSI